MLKRISGLLTILLIFQATAYTPLVYAASDTVVISHVQAGMPGAATQEFIGLYNNGHAEIDITGWCLRNKNDADVACFNDPLGTTQFVLPAKASALVASSSFVAQALDTPVSLAYEPLNASSGSLVGSNDHLSLVDTAGTVVDSYAWSANGGPMMFQRFFDDATLTYLDTGVDEDWLVLPRFPPLDEVELGVIEAPCAAGCPPAIHPHITEVLPNVTGADEGFEFIELYNPSDVPIDMSGYQLWLGLAPKSPVEFPIGMAIAPNGYMALGNGQVSYSLVNTTGKVVLKTLAGELVSETDIYSDPDDDEAWALIAGTWQYTDSPTPGAPNRASAVVPPAIKKSLSSLKPCASNQYRSPETNRCRLIASRTTTRTPCKPNQYRSLETNRCRNIAAAKTPTPCKEGQERNPETNRCRTVKQMSKADYSVLAATTETKPNQWYILAAIAALLALLIGYGIWEWRTELKAYLEKGWRFIQGRK